MHIVGSSLKGVQSCVERRHRKVKPSESVLRIPIGEAIRRKYNIIVYFRLVAEPTGNYLEEDLLGRRWLDCCEEIPIEYV